MGPSWDSLFLGSQQSQFYFISAAGPRDWQAAFSIA